MRHFALGSLLVGLIASTGCNPDCAADPYQPFCTPPDLPTVEDIFGNYCAPELVVHGVDRVEAVGNPQQELPGAYLIVSAPQNSGLSIAYVKHHLSACAFLGDDTLAHPTTCNPSVLSETDLANCKNDEAELAFNQCMREAGLRDAPQVWSYWLRTGHARRIDLGPVRSVVVYFTQRIGDSFGIADAGRTDLEQYVNLEGVTVEPSTTPTNLCHASDYGRYRACGQSVSGAVAFYCASSAPSAD